MNYLAHFHLARADDAWIQGALLGDYVKGPLAADLPPPLRRGIQLHREIDAFSDAHSLRGEFARALPPAYRRYAGIVLDVCCDYWLSRHWTYFESHPLAEFVAKIYAVLQLDMAGMPAPAARMARRLIEHDVLMRYDDAEVIRETLRRIGERLRRENRLRAIDTELELFLTMAEPIFLGLYPQLLRKVSQLSRTVSAGVKADGRGG